MNTVRGGIEFGAMPEVGGSNHLHIMRPAGAEGATDLYFGDDYNYVKMPALYGPGTQGVEIGSSYNSGAVSVWKFGTDGDLVLPAGKTIRDTGGIDLLADPSTGDPAYKGFKSSYGRMWGNSDDPNGPINKIVIYKDTATPSSTIDSSSNQDTFTVTGLSDSDVVVMLVAIGEDVNQTTTAELKTFAESIIDNVILDGGVEGDINTADAMKTAFYNNFATFSATLTDLKTGFEFFSVNNQFNINPAFETGKGATFSGISYNMSNDTLSEGSWGQNVGTHQVGDVFVIPGNTIQDANSNFLSTPANDVTITVTAAPDGYIGSFTVTGTLPRPAVTWPSNYIDDGGDDEYDNGNYITTNLESNISYNDGNVVSGSSAFGGGDYVVTYENSIFGVFAVNTVISSIGTTGGSGMDGYGQADTGSLYGAAASGVSIGDFVFTGSTMTAADDDLYIKAVDDLWLDALDDDVHIRANNDVRIKTGFDFANGTVESEWRFTNDGIINFPDGSQQNTAYTGDYDDLTNKPTLFSGAYADLTGAPTIPADVSDLTDTTNLLNPDVSSLVNIAHTVSLGTDGVLTLPEGGTISEGGGFTGAIKLTPAGGANEYQALMIYPTAAGDGDHIHLTAGGGSTELYLGNDNHFVKLANDGAVVIQANDGVSSNQQWVFSTDGKLQLPAGGDIVDSTGTTVLGGGTTLPADASGYLVNDGTGALSWAAGDGTFSGDYNDLTNKPDLTVYQTASTAFSGSYSDLTNQPALFSGSYADLTGAPTIPADVSDLTDTTSLLFSGAYADLTSKPTLFSGSYTDLTNQPTLFSGAYADLTSKPTLFSGSYTDLTSKPALFSGSYTDLTSKPTIPTSFSSLVNGSFTASLGTDGELSLPTNAYTEAVIKELNATALVLFAQSTGGNIKLLAGSTSAGSAKQWLFNGTSGLLTAPGNLEVDGGKIILNSAGNAYIESVDYGVNSANSAVNIFGGPYQKIKLRAGFGTEAAWTFDTNGDLTAPRNIILNNPVTTVTETETGTIADSGSGSGGEFTFRILKSANPQLITPFADPNFVLKWTGGDAGSLAAAAQAPNGHGVSSLVSDDGTYWNFNSWYGLGGTRPTNGTVFSVDYGVVLSDTTISTTDTNLVIEADAKQYKFGTDGNITLPSGGDIVDSDNNSVIRIEAPFVIKTVGFDAFAGGRYGVNTTSNVVTATLPPSPATGEAIWFADAGGAYATNNLIINPGSGTIMGASGTMTVSTNDQSFGLFYNGTTWRVY